MSKASWHARLERAVGNVRAPLHNIASFCGTNEPTLRMWMRGEKYPTDDEYKRIVQKMPAMQQTLDDLRAEREQWSELKRERLRKREQREMERAKPLAHQPFADGLPGQPAPIPWVPTKTVKETTMAKDQMTPSLDQAALEKAMAFHGALVAVTKLRAETVQKFCDLLRASAAFNLSAEAIATKLMESVTAPDAD